MTETFAIGNATSPVSPFRSEALTAYPDPETAVEPESAPPGLDVEMLEDSYAPATTLDEGPTTAVQGQSAIAVQAARQWDATDRPVGWIGKVFGLVVHTTGGGLPSSAKSKGIYHTVRAVDYYSQSHGCHYVNGWRGVAGGDLLQVANEREQANGVGVGEQRRSIDQGRFEKDLPARVVAQWRARWPGVEHPLRLLPGTKTANSCYVHVECVPCVFHHGKKLITEATPMRTGLRFTQAQHEAVALLACDIARRNGWPMHERWWRSARLVGHEDLTPYNRHDKVGGWDPGGMRAAPYFDWDFVYAMIERECRVQTPALPAWWPFREADDELFSLTPDHYLPTETTEWSVAQEQQDEDEDEEQVDEGFEPSGPDREEWEQDEWEQDEWEQDEWEQDEEVEGDDKDYSDDPTATEGLVPDETEDEEDRWFEDLDEVAGQEPPGQEDESSIFEPVRVAMAVARGQRDEKALTNGVFFARHPELGGRAIKSGETALAAEWLDIRDRLVRPLLARASTPVPGTGAATSGSAGLPAGPFGVLNLNLPGRPPWRYPFTAEDALWTARLIRLEAGGTRDNENAAVIWAMFNRFALSTHGVYPTFTKFIQAYSTTLQPVLINWSAAVRHAHKPDYVKTGGTYTHKKAPPGLPKGQLQRHLDMQAKPWAALRADTRAVTLDALRGNLPNPGIGIASEFASTRILWMQANHTKTPPSEPQWRAFTQGFPKRKGKPWVWIGDVPHLDQQRNAFFAHLPHVKLPAGVVTVTP